MQPALGFESWLIISLGLDKEHLTFCFHVRVYKCVCVHMCTYVYVCVCMCCVWMYCISISLYKEAICVDWGQLQCQFTFANLMKTLLSHKVTV